MGSYENGEGLYPFDGTKSGNVGESFKYDQVSYVDYAEGIYVGYKWYETADAQDYWDKYYNLHGRGYQAVVQYPFGYGLSYTTFDWKVVNAPGKREKITADGSYKITVEVTNTGERAGKEVVQLYYAPPYEAGGIEKSAVVLADYAKTGELQPGEKEEVTLSVKARDMASYDLMTAIKTVLQDMSWIREPMYFLFGKTPMRPLIYQMPDQPETGRKYPVSYRRDHRCSRFQ